MMSSEPAEHTTGDERNGFLLIDCDVHRCQFTEEIVKYLSDYSTDQIGFELPRGQLAIPHEGFRGSNRQIGGGFPVLNPELLYRHVVEYPALEIVFVEQSFTPIPAALWLMCEIWQRLGEDVSHLKRSPGEYVREHCWFGNQPISEPDDRDGLRGVGKLMPAEDLLFSCRNYLRWDTADNDAGILRLPDDLEEAMYYGNGQELSLLPVDPAMMKGISNLTPTAGDPIVENPTVSARVRVGRGITS